MIMLRDSITQEIIQFLEHCEGKLQYIAIDSCKISEEILPSLLNKLLEKFLSILRQARVAFQLSAFYTYVHARKSLNSSK